MRPKWLQDASSWLEKTPRKKFFLQYFSQGVAGAAGGAFFSEATLWLLSSIRGKATGKGSSSLLLFTFLRLEMDLNLCSKVRRLSYLVIFVFCIIILSMFRPGERGDLTKFSTHKEGELVGVVVLLVVGPWEARLSREDSS